MTVTIRVFFKIFLMIILSLNIFCERLALNYNWFIVPFLKLIQGIENYFALIGSANFFSRQPVSGSIWNIATVLSPAVEVNR